MRVQMNKVRSSLIVGVAAFMAVAAGLGCSESAFQPITEGAQPWVPPSGWNELPCSTGYYEPIDSGTCKGCTGAIAYALCVGTSFTQCHVRRAVLAWCGVPERDSLFWQRFSTVQLDPVPGLALALTRRTSSRRRVGA